MDSIFFSVIIPTYNRVELLKKAINSVLTQTYKNFEIIIIDNYSNDNTQEVVENFKNIKIIYQKIHNQGIIGKSRNLGIKLSKGKWVAFLDSDDYWYKDRLQKIFNFLSDNDLYEVICTDELIIDKILDKKKIYKFGPYVENFYKRLLQKGNCISTSASIVRKNFLIRKNISFSENKNFITSEDYDFFMNIAFKKAKFKFMHEVMGEHLFHHEGQSSDYIRHKQSVISVVKYHVFEVQDFEKNKEKLWRNLKFNFKFMDLVYCFNNKKRIKSFIIFIKVFLRFPFKTLIYIYNFLSKKFI
jgi:glycosyltransferase involved in cell wall biosynthesis